MKLSAARDKKVIDKFQALLRSGKDFNVRSMCVEAGSHAFIGGRAARRIINNYYNGIITNEMKEYFASLNCGKHIEEIELFSEKFNVCAREARLILRYIKVSRHD